MLEGLLEKFIISYFGDYIENINKNKLSIGLWSGSLELKDILIKSTAINALKLPFKLLYGKIASISIKLPWKKNFSVPTEITIDRIEILLSKLTIREWQFLDLISFDSKIKKLISFSEEKLAKLSEAFNINRSNIDKLLVKIIDNLQMKFKNVNIRIEDANDLKFSMGVTLEECCVVNTNDKFKEEFIDRTKMNNENKNKYTTNYKIVRIKNCGVYLNVNEVVFISLKEVKDFQRGMEEIFSIEDKRVKDVEYLIKPSK